MSKKLVLTVALGFLSCAISLGCRHNGACRGGSCSTGPAGSKGYPSSEYAASPERDSSPEYAGEQASYEEVVQSRSAADTAQKPKSCCKDGSCQY